MIKIFYLIFLVSFLNSCFPVTSHSLKKIEIDNTEKEVIKILGKPYSKKAYYNKKYLVYYIHDDFFSIFSNLKRFPFIGFYPLLRTGEEYWIIIEDNKVVAFASSSNFKNNIPRALNNNGTVVDLEVN